MSFKLFQIRDDIEFIKTYEESKVKYMIKDSVTGTFFAVRFLQFEILRFFKHKAKTAEDCARHLLDRLDVEVDPSQISAFIEGMRSKNVLKIDHHYPLSPLAIVSIRVSFREYVIQQLKKSWQSNPPSIREKEFYSRLLSLIIQNKVYDALALLEKEKSKNSDSSLVSHLTLRLRTLIVESIQKDKNKDPKEIEKRSFDRALIQEVKSIDPSPVLNRLRPGIKVFFSLYSMIIVLSFCAFATYLIVRDERACFTCLADNTIYFFSNYALAFVFGHLQSILHEFGHAMVCYYFGGRVTKMGVIMFYGYVPTLYADVTDAYRMRRYQRILVSMAGAGVQYMFGMLCGFFLLFTETDSFWYKVWWMNWCIGISSILPNYLPAFKNDGYYIATDILRVDNLFSKSFGYCLTKLRSMFSGESVDTDEYPVHERTRLWIFFLFLITQYFAFLYLLQHIAQSSMSRTLSLVPRIFLFLLLVRISFALGQKLLKINPLGWVETLRKYKRAWALILVVAFFALPVSNNLELSAEIAPEKVVPVHSPLDGIVSNIHFRSDQLIHQNASLLTLKSTEVTQSYEKARFALSKDQMTLLESQSGITEEERRSLQAAVEAREERIDYLKNKLNRIESAGNDVFSLQDRRALRDQLQNEEARLSLDQAALEKRARDHFYDLPVLEKNLEISKTAVSNLESKLGERYIFSPIEGFVHFENLSNLEGKHLAKGDAIFEIISRSACVAVEVPESEIRKLSSTSKAIFISETGKKIELRLRSISATPYVHLTGTHRFSIFSEPKKLRVEFVSDSGEMPSLNFGETGKIKIYAPKKSIFMKMFGHQFQNVALSLWKNS